MHICIITKVDPSIASHLLREVGDVILGRQKPPLHILSHGRGFLQRLVGDRLDRGELIFERLDLWMRQP